MKFVGYKCKATNGKEYDAYRLVSEDNNELKVKLSQEDAKGEVMSLLNRVGARIEEGEFVVKT